jgi:hypothetical protein
MFAPYQFLIAIENDRLRSGAGRRRLLVPSDESAALLPREAGVVASPPRHGLGRHWTRAFRHRAAGRAAA